MNAIVHLDYSFSASTFISIFEDRIEFVTVGGLVKGMTLYDILLGVSILRNQKLANIFYRLNLIEAYGTGVPKIVESYEEADEKPRFDVTNNAFKITLPNRNFYANRLTHERINASINRYTEREEQVLNLFDKKDYIVRKDVEEAVGVSQATAIVLLREMTKKGFIIKSGGGRLIRYKLKE